MTAEIARRAASPITNTLLTLETGVVRCLSASPRMRQLSKHFLAQECIIAIHFSEEADLLDLSLAGGSHLPKREEALTLRFGNDERVRD